MRLGRIVILGALLVASSVFAGSTEPYSAARFDQLAKEGKPILVAVHADWCPTCKAQKPIVSRLMVRPEFRDVTELVVDYDKDKVAVRRFRAVQQSTLVGFRGDREVGRSVGDTSESGIEQLVKSTTE